jgi:hypothetical protein
MTLQLPCIACTTSFIPGVRTLSHLPLTFHHLMPTAFHRVAPICACANRRPSEGDTGERYTPLRPLLYFSPTSLPSRVRKGYSCHTQSAGVPLRRNAVFWRSPYGLAQLYEHIKSSRYFLLSFPINYCLVLISIQSHFFAIYYEIVTHRWIYYCPSWRSSRRHYPQSYSLYRCWALRRPMCTIWFYYAPGCNLRPSRRH